MFRKATALLLVLSAAAINAARLAAFVPRDLNARSVITIGGWSLAQTSEGTCPPLAPQCGAQWCCPGALSCIHTGSEDIGEVCCPTDADCSSTFKASPVCADSSWSLWNATGDTSDEAGYFCCLQGQVGLQTGYCVDSADAVTAGAPAVQISTGTGPVQSETSTSGTASVSASITTTTNANSVSSTSKVSLINGTISASTAKLTSTTSNSAQTTTPNSSPATTIGSTPASSSLAAVTTKSEAMGYSSLGATSLGGIMAVVFAFVLL